MDISQRIKNLMSPESKGLIKVRIDNKTSIEEQAKEFFKEVYGLDDLKVNLYLALTSEEQINPLLNGPPASAKTLIAKIIKKNCREVIYYDAAAGSTGAGLISLLKNHRTAKILVVDEYDKMKKNDANVLLGLLNDGSVDKDLKDESIHFKMEGIKVIGTCNTTKKLSKPLLSRMQVYNIPPYSDDEFIDVVCHCLDNKVDLADAVLIAKVLISHDLKNVRQAIAVGNMVKKGMTQEEIVKVIETLIKYSTNQVVDYN